MSLLPYPSDVFSLFSLSWWSTWLVQLFLQRNVWVESVSGMHNLIEKIPKGHLTAKHTKWVTGTIVYPQCTCEYLCSNRPCAAISTNIYLSRNHNLPLIVEIWQDCSSVFALLLYMLFSLKGSWPGCRDSMKSPAELNWASHDTVYEISLL